MIFWIIMAVVFIVFIATCCYAYWYKNKRTTEEHRKEARDFVRGYYKSLIYENIKDVVNTIDPSEYSEVYIYLLGFMNTVADNVYDTIMEYCKEGLKNKSLSNQAYKIMSTIGKSIIKDVIDFQFIHNKDTLYNTLLNKWYNTFEDGISGVEEEDRRLQKLADEYETESIEVDEVEVYDFNKIPDDVIIIPQRDEEEEYDPEDISQEIIEESPLEDMMESDIFDTEE